MRIGVSAMVLAGVGALCASHAGGEVVDAATGGFTVARSVEVAAAPADVYHALTEVGSWWSSDHTFSGDAANLTLDARAGGCWCERLPGGGSVRHLVVVFADPPRRLRLQGGLGPLQALAVTGSLTWTLTPSETGTRTEYTYTVSGYREGGLQALAPLVDGVLAEQLSRLARYAATPPAKTPVP